MAIVVVGTAFVDIKGFPLNAYIPGGRNAGKIEVMHGGVGRNVAEDIANAGIPVSFVSMADNTSEGDNVIKRLKDSGVDTSYVLSVPDGMGMWLAVFDETGDVVASISKRPNMEPMAKLLEEKGDEIFSDCDSVVLEIDLEESVVRSVFKYAQKYHKRIYAVVANMSIATQRRELLKYVDCFVCNAEEAGIHFLRDYIDMSPEELSAELAERVAAADIPSMVVTLGDKGAVYADRYGNKGEYPARRVQVRDTTGAGDAFCAGTAIGLTYGKTLPEAIEIGTRLAASVIIVPENVCPRFEPKELGIELEEK